MVTSLPQAYDEEVDCVVIGSGFAGLAAAIEAKLAGCSVIILEKMKGFGGNSTISGGGIAAAGTRLQKAEGIEDSSDLMYADMLNAGRSLNQPELVRTLTQNSAETFEWTIDFLGVSYQNRVYRSGGHSVSRCYLTENRSGSAIIKKLLQKVKLLGMKVKTQVCLERFLKTSDGRVCGIQARENYNYPDKTTGNPIYIKANKAVILATGGFANDVKFRTSLDPRLSGDVGCTNKQSTTAEALKSAIQAGALPIHLSRIQLGPWASPDEKRLGGGADFASYVVFPYGILVNPLNGSRFINELADRHARSDAILSVGNPCIGVADMNGLGVSGIDIEKSLRKGVVNKFNRIDDIAEYYQIPLSPFLDTIKRFNSHFESGLDEDFSKPLLQNAKHLNKPPYYCIRLWPKIHYTMGGILINPKAQVLDLSKQPIPGLYAAGEVTGGIHGASRLANCATIDCLVFGRIAGKNVMS